MGHWGTRDFDPHRTGIRHLTLRENMIEFYNTEARPFLSAGRMIAPHPIVCETVRLSDFASVIRRLGAFLYGDRPQNLVHRMGIR